VLRASDESLLAGLASGDPRAAAAFVRRFQGRVFGLALTIVGDRQAAEDVAQEAFLRAWRHAAAYDARRGRVSTWLLAITRNLAIDALRLRGWDPVDPEAVASRLALAGSERAADEQALMENQAEELRCALVGLPEQLRRALVLAAYFGRTAQEISELESVPLGTAKTRIRTAMLKLRDRLEVPD
jgi:RNA polymerase sigma-70 factor (ECF subfamily)